MQIIKSFLTKNPCYKANKKITVKKLMLHSVGCPQPKASVFIDNYNKADHSVCVHGFIDGNTGETHQTLPWDIRASHCGGELNNSAIAIEICEPSTIKYTGGASFTITDKQNALACIERTYSSAVELFAYLCEEFNLNPLTDIISHKEAGVKGLASKHEDIDHLWKQSGSGYTMDRFRKDVMNAMNNGLSSVAETIKSKYEVGDIDVLSELNKASEDTLRLIKLLAGIESVKPKEEVIPKATYQIIGTTHVIEVDPRKIWNVETQCATNKTTYNNFVNSVFFMNQANGKVFPQGMVVNAAEVMSNYQTHGKPVATLIIHSKDDVEMKYVTDITKEKNVWFAVSGFGIYPNITALQEGFTGSFSDVTRECARVIIGYRKKDNKVVIAVRDKSTAERARMTAENLELDFAISLDGGGSATLKVDGKYKFKGDGRKLYGGIIWE